MEGLYRFEVWLLGIFIPGRSLPERNLFSMRASFFGILLLVLLTPALAIPTDEVPNPRQRDGGWVSDTANLLNADGVKQLNKQLTELERTNGIEMAVVTIKDTPPGLTPKQFATELFNKWGIGKKNINNGVLFLVVVDKRRAEIEVGDGSRRNLSDKECTDILTTKLVPEFRAGRPQEGILAGVKACLEELTNLKISPLDGGASVTDAIGILDEETKREIQESLHEANELIGLETWFLIIDKVPKGKTPKTYAESLGDHRRDVAVQFLIVEDKWQLAIVSSGRKTFHPDDAEVARIREDRFAPLIRKGLKREAMVGAVRSWTEGLVGAKAPEKQKGQWISDNAKLLSANQVAPLNQTLQGLEKVNGTEFIVATVKDKPKGVPLDKYAQYLLRTWKPGKVDQSNGVLLLVSVPDQKVLVLVAKQARKFLTEQDVQKIVDETMTPLLFKKGQSQQAMGIALAAGVKSCISKLKVATYHVEISARDVRGEQRSYASGREEVRVSNIVWMAQASIFPLMLGGGAWFYFRRRRRPRICPHCRQPMLRLSELEDDAYLDAGQCKEEELGSIDYDVWYCGTCDSHSVERYRKWFSGLTECPQCGYRTLDVTRRTIRSATEYSTGQGEETSDCRHCKYSNHETYTIPRIQKSSSSSSWGSSSSSSSSSSFGGGSSSGGGGGASW